jgi:hypothetical protein
MRKLLPILVFLLVSVSADAQNWNPLNPVAQQYYVNVNGYIKTTSLDSVALHNDLLHYYPSRRLHFPAYGVSGADTTGGWLGADIIRKTDGTYFFPNYWNDTIKLKVFAPIGETWTFYQGADSVYYIAEVTALDTMTILGDLDSVRKVTLTAYANGNLIASDSFNNTELILSKEHGFYATLEMYLFPFRAPGSSQIFDDYYLANSLSSLSYTYNLDPSLPGKNCCIFRLVDPGNPTPAEFVQWNVGDIYEHDACFTGMVTPVCSSPYMYKLDTVISKTFVNGGVEYILSGWRASPVYQQNSSNISYYAFRTGRDTVFFSHTGTYFEPLGVTEAIAASFDGQRTTHYFLPGGLGMYHSDIHGSRNVFYGLGGQGTASTYGRGMGQTGSFWFAFSDFQIYGHEYISYSVINGVESGTYFFPDTNKPVTNYITNINETSQATIYPNPASGQLNIETSLSNYQLSLINVTGQVVYRRDACDRKQVIDVEGLASGVYNLKLETAEHEVINRKAVIQN